MRWRDATRRHTKEPAMLIDLLAYMALGLLLALPLWRLLRWLAVRYGWYTPSWHYLRPYLPGAAPGAAPAPSSPPSP
jgi:hypothetical protein